MGRKLTKAELDAHNAMLDRWIDRVSIPPGWRGWLGIGIGKDPKGK